MSYRKLYNQIGVFSSITPATGGHFIDASGNIINSIYSITGNITGYASNSIYALKRITDAGYSFSESRIDVKSFGNFGTIIRPIITTPPVSLKFSYNLMGLYNEYILGFNLSSGNNITPISGFLDRTYQFPIYRDCKNIFIATDSLFEDINFINPPIQVLNNTTGQFLNNNLFVYEFGDCYLDSYKMSASIGNFPQATVDYTCYNINYSSGASGHNIPSLNPKDNTIRSGTIYCLPPVETGNQVSVLVPGDITLNINDISGNYPNNLPIDFNDIKIQNFNIDLNLNREALTNIGYRLPLDRIINPPIYANLSVSAIVGDSQSGSFIDFINNDINYNIYINMKYSRNPGFSGIGINYKFLGAKFNNIDLSDSINDKRLVNFSLSSELIPDSINGFFISGQLGNLIKYPY